MLLWTWHNVPACLLYNVADVSGNNSVSAGRENCALQQYHTGPSARHTAVLSTRIGCICSVDEKAKYAMLDADHWATLGSGEGHEARVCFSTLFSATTAASESLLRDENLLRGPAQQTRWSAQPLPFERERSSSASSKPGTSSSQLAFNSRTASRRPSRAMRALVWQV